MTKQSVAMKYILATAILLTWTLVLAGQANDRKNENIDVIRYVYRLSLEDGSDKVRGLADIELMALEDVDSLHFDLRNINAEGRGMSVNSLSCEGNVLQWVHRGDRLSFPAPWSVLKGRKIIVTIDWEGVPADGLVISTTKYGARSFFSDHWPDRASHYLPCIDHPSDKAAIEFIITAPKHYSVVASGLLTDEREVEGGLRVSHWREDVPLPMKVVAFAVADFSVAQAGEYGGIPVSSWVYPENREEGFSDYAVALVPLEYYSSLVGPYPYGKLANVQSKTMFGGLENAGNIFYSEGSVTGRGRAEGLIAHEIAHQWFGNSVTEADWHHIWLSEGFATYLTSMYWEHREGTDRMKSEMRSARDRVLRASARTPSPLIDTSIVNLMSLLGTNSYQKGAWVLHMLRQEIGYDSFVDGLRLYYSRYRDSNALSSDLQQVMEEVSGKKLGEFFHQWLYVAGEPELKIDKAVLPGGDRLEIRVSQMQEFLFDFRIGFEVSGSDGISRGVMHMNGREGSMVLPLRGELSGLTADPDVLLLFREHK